jgi:hypothetical protein
MTLRNLNGLSTTINMAMKRMSFGVIGRGPELPVASLDTVLVLPWTGGKVAPADDLDVERSTGRRDAEPTRMRTRSL